MTPERWRQIEALYNAAHDKGKHVLADVDPSLRLEVENLLAYDSSGQGDSAPLVDESGDPLSTKTEITAGYLLGRYRIDSLIGQGGMGQVFRATDTRLGRAVALKICEERFTGRFEREARAIAALNHPNICTLFDVGPDYLVMELIEGETLAERVSRGPLALEEALQVCVQIANALEAAHAKGITHRDLKPANLKLTPSGRVKVLDFGLAKFGVAGPSASLASEQSALTALTRPGVIIGTPAYMSPEQMRCEPANHGADIWAIGCVLFELLTGHRPFKGIHVTEVIASVLRSEPDWTALPVETPVAVREILRCCLRKEVQHRYTDVAAVRLRLEDSLRSLAQHPSAPPTQSREAVQNRSQWHVQSLAVLPLTNASGDDQMEYLSDGLTDDIFLAIAERLGRREELFPGSSTNVSTVAFMPDSCPTSLPKSRFNCCSGTLQSKQ